MGLDNPLLVERNLSSFTKYPRKPNGLSGETWLSIDSLIPSANTLLSIDTALPSRINISMPSIFIGLTISAITLLFS